MSCAFVHNGKDVIPDAKIHKKTLFRNDEGVRMLFDIHVAPNPAWHVPSKQECLSLWEKYEMLDNIREHSLMVAKAALFLAKQARAVLHKDEKMASLYGVSLEDKYVVASALLHDIAKTYTIQHGGDHAALGAAIVRAETGNPYLGHAVISHVIWPWENGDYSVQYMPWRLPLLISYADKRICHNMVVGVDERFQDLMDRYGTDAIRRKYIQENYEQCKQQEKVMLEQGFNIQMDTQTLNALEL